MRFAAFDEVYPVANTAGCGEGGSEAHIVDKAVIQRVITDDDMGICGGASGKRGQHAGNGFLHAAVRRIAAHLEIGVKLEGKEKVRRMGTVRDPKRLSGTFRRAERLSLVENSPRPHGWRSAGDASENAGTTVREQRFPHNGRWPAMS